MELCRRWSFVEVQVAAKDLIGALPRHHHLEAKRLDAPWPGDTLALLLEPAPHATAATGKLWAHALHNRPPTNTNNLGCTTRRSACSPRESADGMIGK